MRDKEKQKKWSRDNLRTVKGWRLLAPATIFTLSETAVKATPNHFFTHKTSTRTFLCETFPGLQFHIPRTWLERAKIYKRK